MSYDLDKTLSIDLSGQSAGPGTDRSTGSNATVAWYQMANLPSSGPPNRVPSLATGHEFKFEKYDGGLEIKDRADNAHPPTYYKYILQIEFDDGSEVILDPEIHNEEAD